MIKDYDHSEEYETEILPIIHQLLLACEKNSLPMFVSIAVVNKDNETIYKNEMLSAFAENVELYKDHISDHACISDNWAVSPLPVSDNLNIDEDTEKMLFD